MLMMNTTAADPGHFNGTVTTHVGVTSTKYNAALGVRLQPGGYDDDVSICRGFKGYFCYFQHLNVSDNPEYYSARMRIKKCNTDNMIQLESSSTTSNDMLIKRGSLYEMRFLTVGHKLTCSLLGNGAGSKNTDYLYEIEVPFD